MFRTNLEPYILRQTLIAVCLNISQIVKGYTVGWSSPIILKLQDIEQTPLPRMISTIEASWVTSLSLYGLFGAFFAGYVADIIGRRSCLIIGGVVMLLSYSMLAAATTLSVLYAGRFLSGFSSIFLAITSIIYIGEIASPNIRGVILTSTGVFHSLGALLAYCVGPFVSYAEVSYVAVGFSFAYVATSFYLPESPVYYVIRDDEEAARASLEYLGRGGEIENELQRMIETTKDTKNTKHVWRELFTVKGNRKSLFIAIPLFLVQQSNGAISVMLYATTIFKDAGSSVPPDIATIIVGATLLIGTVFSPMVVDKYGRKFLLIVSISGCLITMGILGAYFYLEKTSHKSIESIGWLPLASLVFTLLSFGFGLSMIPNTLVGELFRPNIRGLGSSISLSAGWISGLLSATLFGYMVLAMGNDVTFFIYAAVGVAALIFVVVYVPETKGKSLTEIDVMMSH